MLFPVRCYSCGKVIAQLKQKYDDMLSEGKTRGEAMDKLGIKKLCCRRMFTTEVNIIDEVLIYAKGPAEDGPPRWVNSR